MGAFVDRPSPNHDQRPPDSRVDMLVLHYTDMVDAETALARLCDPANRVSAHYLIARDGRVFSLVPEDRRAWHAGVAFWRGAQDINARSIGIELDNPGHRLGYVPFPDIQMTALESLCIQILSRHSIARRNVVGHSDVAPRRKMDPGELFDWPRLARAGIGLWPTLADHPPPGEAEALALLTDYGYETEDPTASVTAFQRHFRPRRVDGRLDRETGATIAALRGMVAQGT